MTPVKENALHTRPGSMKQRAKALIVTAACWGLIPVKLADWIIKRGGLRHE